MVTPAKLLVGDFNHSVERAASSKPNAPKPKHKTEAQSSLRPGLKKMQVPGKGFLKEAVKLAGTKSCPVLLSRRA